MAHRLPASFRKGGGGEGEGGRLLNFLSKGTLWHLHEVSTRAFGVGEASITDGDTW